jgi:hypothetical protein
LPSLRTTGIPPHLRAFGLSAPCRNSILFLLLALAAVAAYGQASPADESKNTIRGVVINQLTETPIPRALVYSSDHRYATLTDGEGRFEFSLPKANSTADTGETDSLVIGLPGDNTLLLMARKPGFLDDRGRREIRATPGDDVTIKLEPEALIKGRVTLSTGEPAAGASVQLFFKQVEYGLFRWRPNASERTNSAGEFRFAELRPGSYRIATGEFMDNDPLTMTPGGQRYGFPPVYFPGGSDFRSASTIEVTAGGTVETDFSLTLEPYYDVKIPVTNSDLNGAVALLVQGQRGPGYSLGYNSGSQTIEGMLPSGNYVIEASTYGASSVTGTVNLRVAAGPANGPGMTMVPTSAISLEVKEEFSEKASPISGVERWTAQDGRTHTYSLHGARLYLQASAEDADDQEVNRGAGSIRQPTGPNDDSLVLENLQPGRYWLRLTSSRGYVASATSGGVDVLHEPIVVAAAATIPVEVTMRDDGGKIEGTIPAIAQSGAKSGAFLTPWVYCVPRPNSPGQFETFGVSGEGKFQSQVMAPGDYLLLAFAEEKSLPFRDAEAMKAYESMGEIVHVSAGQSTSVQLAVIPGNGE